MFGFDFYPTPEHVIDTMLDGLALQGKVVLEPSGGKGNIVDRLKLAGAEVIACETNKDLCKILGTKCKIVAEDFLTVQAQDVSHIHAIVMNPPYSADEKHIIHAWEIAPPGCKILALCNFNTIDNPNNRIRKQLIKIIEQSGSYINLGPAFDTAERKTNAIIAMITLLKPGGGYETEFEGFFMDEDPNEQNPEGGVSGIMPYNAVRDLVNRYVGAIKIYDEQLATGAKMNDLIGEHFVFERTNYNDIRPPITFQCSRDNQPVLREEFKKELQKAGWTGIFRMMNMQKYATEGLQSDINKFVEQQQKIPFTMRNIYRMLEIVIGTQSQRMDKALEEVFDKLTQHTHDNRFGVEGWKSNSHFLLSKHFVVPWIVENRGYGAEKVSLCHNGNYKKIEDMQKAMCYILGVNYDECTSLWKFCSQINMAFGQWYYWGFFEIKGFKKGTMHFRFQNEDSWAKFNQNISRIKGYPLFEGREQTKYQDRNTGRKKKAAA